MLKLLVGMGGNSLCKELYEWFDFNVDTASVAAFVKVVLFTGLRESEAIGLTWDCIDFKSGTIKVCKQLQKRPLIDGGTVFASLKND